MESRRTRKEDPRNIYKDPRRGEENERKQIERLVLIKIPYKTIMVRSGYIDDAILCDDIFCYPKVINMSTSKG